MAWRSWLILSGPMVERLSASVHQATPAGEEPKKLTPDPAKVILDVEAITHGRSALPAAAQ